MADRHDDEPLQRARLLSEAMPPRARARAAPNVWLCHRPVPGGPTSAAYSIALRTEVAGTRATPGTYCSPVNVFDHV